jgi:hypothetical protein
MVPAPGILDDDGMRIRRRPQDSTPNHRRTEALTDCGRPARAGAVHQIWLQPGRAEAFTLPMFGSGVRCGASTASTEGC